MRVAVAGKGGSGKTTIAGILARALGRRTGNVVAIDGDSNPNLSVTLGIAREEVERIPPLPRDILETYTDVRGRALLRLSLSPDKILEDFSFPAPDHVRLLVVGKVDHAGVG